MTPDIADEHSVKRRRRPAKSCDACRARKVRCDQKMPCGPCKRARSTPKCVYAPDVVRIPSPDPTPEESGPGGAPLPTPVQLRHRTPQGSSSLDDCAEADQLRRQIKDLQNRVDCLESKVETNAAKTAAAPTADLRVAPIQPKLRQTADKNKLFGANHWIHTAKHVRRITEIYLDCSNRKD